VVLFILPPSGGEARRRIDGGGIKIDGASLPAGSYNVDANVLAPGAVLQFGKRKWARLV